MEFQYITACQLDPIAFRSWIFARSLWGNLSNVFRMHVCIVSINECIINPVPTRCENLQLTKEKNLRLSITLYFFYDASQMEDLAFQKKKSLSTHWREKFESLSSHFPSRKITAWISRIWWFFFFNIHYSIQKLNITAVELLGLISQISKHFFLEDH